MEKASVTFFGDRLECRCVIKEIYEVRKGLRERYENWGRDDPFWLKEADEVSRCSDVDLLRRALCNLLTELEKEDTERND